MAIDTEIVTLSANGKTLQIEIAANLFKMIGEHDEIKATFALYTPTSEAISAIFRALLPLDWRPPTQRQLSFATTISAALGIPLPENALRDATVCSAFIGENADEYSAAKEGKQLAKQAEKALKKRQKPNPESSDETKS